MQAYDPNSECDLDELMQAAFKTWLTAAQADCIHKHARLMAAELSKDCYRETGVTLKEMMAAREKP